MKKLIAYIIAVIACTAAHASDLTAQADSAYLKEDYRQAIRLYNQAIASEGVSPEIYYNLGNAYYRINSMGKAIISYQRALNIDPSMTDARLNLNFVKSKIADLPEDDTSFLQNVHNRILGAFTPDAWAWISFLLFTSLLGCVALYIFSNNVRLRKTGFFGGFIVMLLTAYSMVIAFQSSRRYRHSDLAVIVTPMASLQSQPGAEADKGNKKLQLPEGTMVEVTDSMTVPGEEASPKWYHVKINNNTKAWINSADVENI